LASSCESLAYRDVDHAFELAMRGDPAAENQTFALCIPRCKKVLSRLVFNAENREDALQDGLLNAYRHLDQFRGTAQFTTWIHSIVVNAAKSRLRKQLSRPRACSLDDPVSDSNGTPRVADMIPDSAPGIDEEYERLEQYLALAAVIQTLPASWRTVIRLHDFEVWE
jgi:RNA polymerase sigma-70 factor, ECF subfamily